jgi:cytochrome c oxidase subunit IV
MKGVQTYVWVWIGLMILLGLTLGSSFVSLHGFNAATNLLIAVAKAALVAVYFMRLRSSDALIRLAAVVGVVWALILIGLSLVDELTRST